MRILVFFDLPTETANDRRNYRKFRKDLLKNGFFMMQESVYCRMVLNKTSEKTVIDNIYRMRPPQGLVQVLTVTEKQNVLSDIYAQCNGETGRAVLSSNDKSIDINNGIDLLTDFVAFDGNRKGLLTKILHAMEKTANDEVYFQRTHKLMAELECYMNDLAMEQEVDLAYEKLSLNNLLKAVGVKVIIDYNKFSRKAVCLHGFSTPV